MRQICRLCRVQRHHAPQGGAGGVDGRAGRDARLFGAVNTVCIRDGRAYGYNTDGAGFLRALNDEGIDPAGKRVLVLGAGGGQGGVPQAGPGRGGGGSVQPHRGQGRRPLRPRAGPPAPAGFDPDTLRREAAECGLLVNCTSLGMEGRQGSLRSSPSWAPCPPGRRWWIIYAPAETELLRRAREGAPDRQRLRTAGQPGGALPGALHRHGHRRRGDEAAAGGRAAAVRRPGDPVDRGRRGVVCCAAVKMPYDERGVIACAKPRCCF